VCVRDPVVIDFLQPDIGAQRKILAHREKNKKLLSLYMYQTVKTDEHQHVPPPPHN
jgi:hypothetical protein